MTRAIASRTVPPGSESKAKGNSLSPVSRDTLTPGKRRVAAPCRQRQWVTSSGSRFSSRSTRRSVSSLSVLTLIAAVSAGCSPVGSVGAIFVGASNPFSCARRAIAASASRPAGTLPFANSDSAFENTDPTGRSLAPSGPRAASPSRAEVPPTPLSRRPRPCVLRRAGSSSWPVRR